MLQVGATGTDQTTNHIEYIGKYVEGVRVKLMKREKFRCQDTHGRIV
jgi:hypothetical protein